MGCMSLHGLFLAIETPPSPAGFADDRYDATLDLSHLGYNGAQQEWG